MKKCTKCGVEKTLDSFNKQKACKDGLQYMCKDCKKDCKKAYYEANKEELLAKDKSYYEANKERKLAKTKIWREANKEKVEATRKVYYEANKEELLANSKAYYEANKEKVKAYCEDNKEKISANGKRWTKNNPGKVREISRRRRAKKLEVGENYTKEDEAFTKRLFDHACFNCGSTENLEVDHYRPLSKGNALTLTNAIILCKSCNSSKSSKDPEQFFSEEQITIIQEVFDMVEEQV